LDISGPVTAQRGPRLEVTQVSKKSDQILSINEGRRGRLTDVFRGHNAIADQAVHLVAEDSLEPVCCETRNFFVDDDRGLSNRLVKAHSGINAIGVCPGVGDDFNEWHQVRRIEWMADEYTAWILGTMGDKL
jgi:hypothetical protein